MHDDVTVHAGKTIYQTDSWWKAAVLHSYGDSDPEIGIYLWNYNEDWTRKNKYHVKTAEAWEADKVRIDQYLAESGDQVASQDAFPVSDYYRLARGETVFKTDDWWKAIVAIDQKGSYDTYEVIIYLWQRVDDDWRRRQKYAVKNLDDWSGDQDAVDALLDADSDITRDGNDAVETSEPMTSTDQQPESGLLDEIEAEVMDLHLGSGVDERD
ncbi:hypothetical protein [Halarchaeum salinum]|uniref:hypothetical protein n=1 Tax=Halarchaeum salinum TaxID=489912 RepID=UPI001B8752BC